MSRLNTLDLTALVASISRKRGAIFGLIIFSALIAFEIFNFSTTQYALHDVLGELKFLGMQWATILAIAFCGIDFAGIARIFTPEQGKDEPAEVWYLFGAWLLAAAMNATLTWWGVAVAIQSHPIMGTAVVGAETMTTAVPIFVALMVWVIRVLIIGTFSIAGDRMFTLAEERPAYYRRQQPSQGYTRQPQTTNVARVQPGMAAAPARNQQSSVPLAPARGNSLPPLTTGRALMNQSAQGNSPRPAPKPEPVQKQDPVYVEPTYHSLGGVAAAPRNDNAVRR